MNKNSSAYDVAGNSSLQKPRNPRELGGVVRISHIIFVCALVVSLAGCSIRPLPKNVTRDVTLQIINKIRCETREALIARFLVLLKDIPKGHQQVSELNLQLLRWLKHMGTSEEVMGDLTWNRVDEYTSRRARAFAASVITYNFEFTILEQKQKNGKATFSMPFIGGRMGFVAGAGSDKTRKNVRTVVLTDTFYGLVTGKNPPGSQEDFTGLDCDIVDKPRKHWIYPITGNIGMAEVIDTFVEMELMSGAISLKTFSDKLTFNTNFNVSANPVVNLDTPVLPKHFRLVKADANYKAFRQDQHQVFTVIVQGKLAHPPTRLVTEEMGYIKLSDFDDQFKDFPAGHEIGLSFKKTYKKEIPLKGKDADKSQRFVDPAVVEESKKLFFVPKSNLDEAIRKSLRESRRLEDESKQRDLDALIGR